MNDKLKHVRFTLNEGHFAIGDLEINDSDDLLKERDGLFHRWGDVCFYNQENQSFLTKTVGIVEEKSTGIVFEVSPHCIIFER